MERSSNTYSANPSRIGIAGIWRQTIAMTVDAYREINAKKLFWITMLLSGCVVLLFAAIGFDDAGPKFLWMRFPLFPRLNTRFIPLAELYKQLFIVVGVKWWLGVLAVALGLVSTSGVFPEFISSGSVDLYLARPLGRVRLFLTKYLVALLFVACQVAVFCVGSFFVVGLRAGSWSFGLFSAIPIVTIMFSYLWCVSALFGVLTRSTIASLLMTGLVWLAIFAVHTGDTILTVNQSLNHVRTVLRDRDIATTEKKLADLESKIATTRPSNFDVSQQFQFKRALERLNKERAQETNKIDWWQQLFVRLKTFLPKMTDTAELVERVISNRDVRAQPNLDDDAVDSGDEEGHRWRHDPRFERELEKDLDNVYSSRTVGWIMGTSLVFEMLVLGFATLLFARRDY